MPLFVTFVFGAVILGAGVMLSPAWPTPQPRVGLAAAMALALIIGGAVFYSMLFGWDTLVVDYMLFALVVGIFLGGTLSVGQARAEKRGEILLDKDQGWPGPQDLILLGTIAVMFLGLMFYLAAEPAAEIPGLGYAALSARLTEPLNIPAGFEQGAVFTTYPPGFSAIIAYLHQQLGQDVQIIQRAIGAVLALLCVWLAYDLGAEIRDKWLGRAMAGAILGGGLVTLFIDGWFTLIVALVFALAFTTYFYRYLRYGYPVDAVGAGLMLGAVLITHPAAMTGVAIGYIMWMIALLWGQFDDGHRSLRQRWWVLVVPFIALIASAPWWVWRVSQPTVNTPVFDPVQLFSLPVLLALLIPVLFTTLAALTSLRRHIVVVQAAGWLLTIIIFGLVSPATPAVLYTGVIPLSILSGIGIVELWKRFAQRQALTA